MSTDQEVIADKSGSTDDAQSVAVCETGKVVSYCESNLGQVHKLFRKVISNPALPSSLCEYHCYTASNTVSNTITLLVTL